jgi:outer membrane protein assembly factor BamB
LNGTVFLREVGWGQSVSYAVTLLIPVAMTLYHRNYGENKPLKIKNKTLAILLVVVIIFLSVLAGCTSSSVLKGWAGAAEINGTIFYASQSGNVYAIDSATGTVRGTPVKLTAPASSGGLSCIPSCSGQQTVGVALYSSPAVNDGMVYIGGADGKVYAFSLVDGKLIAQSKWEYPRQGNVGSIIGGLTIANSKLYFTSAVGTVYALTTAEGYLVWSFEIGQKVWSAPAVDGNTVYISSLDKKLYAFDATNGSKKWEYETDGAISSTPVVKDGVVYVGTFDRYFYAINGATGTLLWKYPLADEVANSPQNWFWSTPVVHNDVVYAPCLDGKIYALNAKSGSLVEAYDFQLPISSSLTVVGDNIVVAASDLSSKVKTSKIFIINTLNNQWHDLTGWVQDEQGGKPGLSQGVTAPLFANNGVVYIHTTKDNFYGLNLQTGVVQKFSLQTTQ